MAVEPTPRDTTASPRSCSSGPRPSTRPTRSPRSETGSSSPTRSSSTSTATRWVGCPRATAERLARGRRRGVGRRADPRLGPLDRRAGARRRPASRDAHRRRARARSIVSDSTTVNFYKLALAALEARPGRRVVVTDRDNFPTDRYVLEGLARQRDLEIAWLEPDPVDGPTVDDVAAALAAHPGDVALVTLSHVNYRSAAIADMAAITALAHDAGALDGLGPLPLGRLDRGRPRGGGRRPRRRLHVQVPQRRPGRAGLAVRPPLAPGRAAQPDPGLVRPARPVRDGPGLRPGAGHHPVADRNARRSSRWRPSRRASGWSPRPASGGSARRASR